MNTVQIYGKKITLKKLSAKFAAQRRDVGSIISTDSPHGTHVVVIYNVKSDALTADLPKSVKVFDDKI